MPLPKRRAVFVKIDSGRCNGIFCVGAVGEFTAALKNLTSTVYFHHCLQQQLDNFWVEIAANQHLGGGSHERHGIHTASTLPSFSASTAVAAMKGNSVAVSEFTPPLPRICSAASRVPLPAGPTAMRLPLSCDSRSNGSFEE